MEKKKKKRERVRQLKESGTRSTILLGTQLVRKVNRYSVNIDLISELKGMTQEGEELLVVLYQSLGPFEFRVLGGPESG